MGFERIRVWEAIKEEEEAAMNFFFFFVVAENFGVSEISSAFSVCVGDRGE